MLGGAVGALADPFQLMNMAQNDLDGLQESIINAASAAVSFNSETGDFAISATEMRRLRATSSALGMDYEELSNTAVKELRRQEALSQLDILDGYDDETKEMLANIGQFDGGELKFSFQRKDKDGIPFTELISASDLNKKQLKELTERSETSNMSALETAQSQLTVLQKIQYLLENSARTVSGTDCGF